MIIKPLPSFAYNFSLRRYSPGVDTYLKMLLRDNFLHSDLHPVGPCRFTVSKPVFKAPMVVALEARSRWTAFKRCFQI